MSINIVPQKPTFDEMLHILKLIVDRKAFNNEGLIKLGVDPGHVEFMDSCYMLPYGGGAITGKCFLQDRIEAQYHYHTTKENGRQEWDTRKSRLEMLAASLATETIEKSM